MKISVDFETYSEVDIRDCGLYKYIEDPSFEILLIGYAIDDDDPVVLDLTQMSAGQVSETKRMFEAWMKDPTVQWAAYNAEFEMEVFSHWFGYRIPLDNWYDTMVTAAYCGLPRSLEDVGEALNMSEDEAKLKDGKALVRYFCTPCKPTKANGGRTRNRAKDDPEKWERFKFYNSQDVVAERAIAKRLEKYKPPKSEHDAWMLSVEINRRGVMIDKRLVENAVSISNEHTAILMSRLKELTQLENPNSVSQLKDYLGMDSLAKDTVSEELKTADGVRKEILELRQEAGKSSVKKYTSMLNCVCKDDRIRGMFVFYGANRTGRFSGRLTQVHNLPQNHIPDLENARKCVEENDRELLEMLFGNVPDTMSQLIRTAFIAKPGYTFAVADFSAIEARVVAWLAKEKWRMQLFADGGDIYCQSASEMFKVPVVKHGINGHLRQKGKIAELACIAEGSLVPTNHGLKRIQDITQEDMVWDGGKWVQHQGVVCRGMKEVITYQGLTATPDHMVYVRGQRKPLPFGEIVKQGMTLSQTAMCPPGEDHHESPCLVYDIVNAGPRHRFAVSGTLVHNCGYGGSAQAMINMGALKMGLEEDELPDIVRKWREASPNIVKLWWKVDDAVKSAVEDREEHSLPRGVSVYRTPGLLHIALPSGRELRYYKPRLETNRFGGIEVTYGAYEEGRWSRTGSYGPKFVENLTQAISRDCLLESMKKVSLRYPRIVMHVHDEMIVEVPEEEADEALAYMQQCMGEPIPWAPGLLLRGDGYVTKFYRKD